MIGLDVLKMATLRDGTTYLPVNTFATNVSIIAIGRKAIIYATSLHFSMSASEFIIVVSLNTLFSQ